LGDTPPENNVISQIVEWAGPIEISESPIVGSVAVTVGNRAERRERIALY